MGLWLSVHAEIRIPTRSFRSNGNFSWPRPQFGKLSSACQESPRGPRGALCWGMHAARHLQTQSSPATLGRSPPRHFPLAPRRRHQCWKGAPSSCGVNFSSPASPFSFCSHAGQPALSESINMGGADGEMRSKKHGLCLKRAQGPAHGLQVLT